MDIDQTVSLPKFKYNNIEEQIYNVDSLVLDFDDLERLNNAINIARLALFKTNASIKKFEREEIIARTNYERALRRAYLAAAGKTEKIKTSLAEIECENLEDTLLVSTQMKSEMVRFANAIRLELQTLQSLGNNLRQQLKIV